MGKIEMRKIINLEVKEAEKSIEQARQTVQNNIETNPYVLVIKINLKAPKIGRVDEK